MKPLFRKYQSTLIEYLINLTLLIAAWGGMFRKSFNSDTLWHMVDFKGDLITRIEDARYLWALTDFLLSRSGWSTSDNTGITILLSLLIIAAAVSMIQNIFREYLPAERPCEKILFFVITNLIFINVLFAELLMFSECALAFALAYFLAALGVLMFKRRRYWRTFVLLLCAVCYYQVAAIFALILISTCIFFQEEQALTGKAILRQLIACLCALGAAALNLLSSYVLVWTGVFAELRKTSVHSGFGQRLQAVLAHFMTMLRDSMTLLPARWATLGVLIFAALVIILSWVRGFRRRKEQILYMLLLFLFCFSLIYVIPFMTGQSDYAPRLVFPFFTAFSVMLMISYQCLFRSSYPYSRGLRNVFAGVLGAYLLLHLWAAQLIVSDHILSNQLDILYANAIERRIRQYEEETGVTVNNLAVIRDLNCPMYYEEVDFAAGQVNERVMGVMTCTLINIMTGNDYRQVTMPEDIYQELFEGRDWDYFDVAEQLVIREDTAYLAVF